MPSPRLDEMRTQRDDECRVSRSERLRRVARDGSAGERFDVIVLDPPAFAKNRASLKAAIRGYKEINLRALKLLNPGGVLITCTCSYHVSEELFLEILAQAAIDAHRRVQIVEKANAGHRSSGAAGSARDLLPEVRDRESYLSHV